jgi:hypothetical protein
VEEAVLPLVLLVLVVSVVVVQRGAQAMPVVVVVKPASKAINQRVLAWMEGSRRLLLLAASLPAPFAVRRWALATPSRHQLPMCTPAAAVQMSWPLAFPEVISRVIVRAATVHLQRMIHFRLLLEYERVLLLKALIVTISRLVRRLQVNQQQQQRWRRRQGVFPGHWQRALPVVLRLLRHRMEGPAVALLVSALRERRKRPTDAKCAGRKWA